ncbi:uncharacterized protein LOC126998587 isoform X8 [Eriocheir sinensis]|uniref:uncharacterized protein LOC126998587 isoform X7 n=1 Tax=Eriocheir sinensis TaxID=95602 RepID=UPI0021CA9736|nr:uncharacterized protein LOC126998587 isoform X7 [Eriocheir sinensis]XP_050716379.1 uncharacterized protein LOC126998587 isoform X8 [Eriocheir sinensis]
MKLFVVWTLVLVLGTLGASSMSLTDGADSKGLLKDGTASTTLAKADVDPCRKFDEGVLTDLPKVSDLKSMKTSLESGTNDTIKTMERRVINNTDEAGHLTGNKTVVEKTTETDVQPNRNVSKTTDTQVVIDKEGKESGEKSVTERETLTQTTPDNGILAQTVEVKKVTDEEGNERKEVVIKKEATLQPLTNATVEKPKDDKAATLLPKVGADDQGKNKTETIFSASGKSDGPQKVERTEERKEILPSNITNEVVLKEKEEILPSLNSTKVTSVETKNITEKGDELLKAERTEERKETLSDNKTHVVLVKEKEEKILSQDSTNVTSLESKNVTYEGDGKDVEKETVIQKEVEKNVCNGDIKEVQDERHLNETIEDLKHQVSDVKNMIKEEEAKAKETSATPSQCTEQKAIAAPTIHEGKVITEVVPAVRPVKVVRKVVPAVRPVKVVRKVVPAVRPVKVVRKVVPAVRPVKVVRKVVPAVRPVKVVRKVVPAVRPVKVVRKVVPAVRPVKVVRKVVPAVRPVKIVRRVVPTVRPVKVVRKVVPAVRQVKVVRKGVPSVRQGKVFVVNRVVKHVTPSVVTKRFPVVTQKKVLAKVLPTVTEGNTPVVTEKKVTEKVAPSVKENVVTIPKREEK